MRGACPGARLWGNGEEIGVGPVVGDLLSRQASGP
jgi:hypothetical protein